MSIANGDGHKILKTTMTRDFVPQEHRYHIKDLKVSNVGG
jgi:hypothetical protein